MSRNNSIASSESYASDTDCSDIDQLFVGDEEANDNNEQEEDNARGDNSDATGENATDADAGTQGAEDDDNNTADDANDSAAAAPLQPREGENPIAFGARTFVHHLATEAFVEIRQIYDKHAMDIESHLWPDQSSIDDENDADNANKKKENNANNKNNRKSIFTAPYFGGDPKAPFKIPASLILNGSAASEDAGGSDEGEGAAAVIAALAKEQKKDNEDKQEEEAAKGEEEEEDFSRAIIEYGIDESEGETIKQPNLLTTWDHYEGGWVASPSALPHTSSNNSSGSNCSSSDPHAHLKLAPFGTRKSRYAFEDELFDIVMTMPLRRLDIFFVIDELRSLDLKVDDASDVKGWGMVENDFAPPLFLWAAAVIRWRLVHLGAKHAETVDGLTCLSDFVYSTTMYILEERALFAEISRRRKGGIVKPSDWKLLKPLRDQYVYRREICRKLLLLAVTNITHFPDAPLDIASEAMWGLRAQRFYSVDEREPTLDMENTDLSEEAIAMQQKKASSSSSSSAPKSVPKLNIRKWKGPFNGSDKVSSALFPSAAAAPTFWQNLRADFAVESSYWTPFCNYLSSKVPLVTIPHPLQHFPVELRNPGVSTDSGATCDICSCRNIRVTYEARKQTAHADDNSTIAQRAQFQFTANLTRAGFDACATCMACMTSEAIAALLTATGHVDPGTSESQKKEENDLLFDPLLDALTDSKLSAVTKDSASSSSTVFNPCTVEIAAFGSRNTVAINNQMRVSRRAIIEEVEETSTCAGVKSDDSLQQKQTKKQKFLLLNIALAPLGAKPLARVWQQGYTEHVTSSALEQFPMNSATNAETIAMTTANRMIAAADLLGPFLRNAATTITYKQVCTSKDGTNNNDDECPICLEELSADVSSSGANAADASAAHKEGEGGGAASGAPAEEDTFACDFPASATTTASANVDGDAKTMTVAEADDALQKTRPNTATQTNCGHWFHTHCLERFMLDNKCTTCPVCRQPDALESLAVKQMKAVKEAEIADTARQAAKHAEEVRKVREQRKKKSAAKRESRNEDGGAEEADELATKRLRTESNTTAGDNNVDGKENDRNNDAAVDIEHVTPEMVRIGTSQTLQQNVYEIRMPIPPLPAGVTSFRLFVGALVSVEGVYVHPLDVGCAVNLKIII